MGESFQPGSWSVEMEVNLFHAMRSHKPVGVNRHFHMVFIHEKLSSPASKKLTAKNVWDHLSTMYDLQALNESEILPFPNKAVDFKLPGELTKLCDDDFPRMENVGTAPEETKAKPEGQAKGGKSSRTETKTPDTKKSSDSKSSTPSDSRSSHSSKPDTKSSTPTSGRGEGKGGGKGGHSTTSHSASSTPDPSPKRTKRTRHNQSAANSPASDAPPTKRRR